MDETLVASLGGAVLASVVYGDGGMFAERPHEFDLLRGEVTLAVELRDLEQAGGSAFDEQRHAEQGLLSPLAHGGARGGGKVVVGEVLLDDHAALEDLAILGKVVEREHCAELLGLRPVDTLEHRLPGDGVVIGQVLVDVADVGLQRLGGRPGDAGQDVFDDERRGDGAAGREQRGEVAVAIVSRAPQARVLDGGRRERRERGGKLDLLVGEAVDAPLLGELETADHVVLRDQRHEQAALRSVALHALAVGERQIVVVDVVGDRSAVRRGLAGRSAARRAAGSSRPNPSRRHRARGPRARGPTVSSSSGRYS